MIKIILAIALIMTLAGCQKNALLGSLGGNNTGASVASPSGNRQTLIQATASDNVGVTKLEFYANGVVIPNCTVQAPPYNCLWSVPVGAGMKYQLQTKAYDAQGNVGTSPTVQVTSN